MSITIPTDRRLKIGSNKHIHRCCQYQMWMIAYYQVIYQREREIIFLLICQQIHILYKVVDTL